MRIHNLKLKITALVLILLYALILYFTSFDCPFDAIFKIPCPGCGMTRAWLSVFKLQFAKAFSYHKMFWSLPVLFVGFLFDGRIFNNKFLNVLIYIIIGTGFLLNWAERLM